MEGYRRVAPLRPVAPYVGGKKQLAARLVALIEQVPHATYAEPFVGMGGVFLRRSVAPKAEVINDASGDVANLFRVLREHYAPLMDLLRFRFTSRRDFDRLTATDPATLTDLQRAVRFLYLQRLAFGGKVAGRNFGVALRIPGRFDVTRLEPMLAELSERLADVVIENLGYAEFLDRYDAPDTLFYLDPPYFGSEDYYGAGLFERADFDRLAARLAALRGPFILSINDAPEIRAIFAAFALETVELTYTLAGADAASDARELIVTPPGLPRAATARDLFGDRVG
jgi:DNA adenine methylase